MKKALLLFICMMPVLGFAQSSGGEGGYNILVTSEGFSFTGDFTISAE